MEVKLEDKHPCTQERVLATICEQLKGIESDIREIKDGQSLFVSGLREREVNAAKYPTPDAVNKAFAKIDKHDTYFTFIGTGLILAWGLLLWVAEKVWK